MKLAPIALFTYKKIGPLKATIAALKRNNLAKQSELIVFSDGPKTSKDIEQIEAVRTYINSITGFKKMSTIFSKKNKGLASSITDGVSMILENHESIIVLEDDLKSSRNFLDFMNQSLEYYKGNSKIMSISGYTPPIKLPNGSEHDNYFTQRASSWGWATYKTQWEKVDWKVSDYSSFKNNNSAKKKFNKMGSDLSFMLSKQMKKTIDSWAIRWCYHQFKNNLYTVFPMTSKIENIGFSDLATHTKGNTEMLRFATPLDISNTVNFNFADDVKLNDIFIKQFTVPYSIKTRVLYKIKGYLFKS